MARNRYYVADGDPKANDPQAAAFAQRLNKLMLDRGWRQSDLTREVQKHIPAGVKFGRHLPSSWLRGRHLPSQMNLEMLARVLNVSISDLVPETVGVLVQPQDKAVQVTMSSNGSARLKLDMELPAEIALKIMALANEAMVGGTGIEPVTPRV